MKTASESNTSTTNTNVGPVKTPTGGPNQLIAVKEEISISSGQRGGDVSRLGRLNGNM